MCGAYKSSNSAAGAPSFDIVVFQLRFETRCFFDKLKKYDDDNKKQSPGSSKTA